MCPEDQRGNQVTFWKYNFISHMSDKHVIQNTDGEEIFAPLHPELVVTTRISRLEEEKMEIPSAYTDTWRKTNDIPESDAIEAPLAAEHEERESRESHKRGASEVSQASTSSRQPSPTKKVR